MTQVASTPGHPVRRLALLNGDVRSVRDVEVVVPFPKSQALAFAADNAAINSAWCAMLLVKPRARDGRPVSAATGVRRNRSSPNFTGKRVLSGTEAKRADKVRFLPRRGCRSHRLRGTARLTPIYQLKDYIEKSDSEECLGFASSFRCTRERHRTARRLFSFATRRHVWLRLDLPKPSVSKVHSHCPCGMNRKR